MGTLIHENRVILPLQSLIFSYRVEVTKKATDKQNQTHTGHPGEMSNDAAEPSVWTLPLSFYYFMRKGE